MTAAVADARESACIPAHGLKWGMHMSAEYAQFLTALGAMAKLVVLSIMLERAMAFVFEHDWFVRLTSRLVPDPADATKQIRESRLPGIKGIVALAFAMSLTTLYGFDVLGVLFNTTPSTMGMLLTGLVAAGGSAGAIAVFQGFLSLNKETRDAMVAARKAEAEEAKETAELRAKTAEANRIRAEAEKVEAETRKRIAELQIAEVEARKKAAGR
jgi:hypothetical protein